MTRVIVTGGTGHVGPVVVKALLERGASVTQIARRAPTVETPWINVADIATTPASAFEGNDVLVHLAGKAAGRDEDELRRVNTSATTHLGQLAAATGLHRVVFLSSTKVYDPSGAVVTAQTHPMPADAYGRSKLAAEDSLRHLRRDTPLTIALVRSTPTIDKPTNPSIELMRRFVKLGLPIPTAGTPRRSFTTTPHLAERIADLTTSTESSLSVVTDTTLTLAEVAAVAAGTEREPRIMRVPSRIMRRIDGIMTRVSDRSLGPLYLDAVASEFTVSLDLAD